MVCRVLGLVTAELLSPQMGKKERPQWTEGHLEKGLHARTHSWRDRLPWSPQQNQRSQGCSEVFCSGQPLRTALRDESRKERGCQAEGPLLKPPSLGTQTGLASEGQA